MRRSIIRRSLGYWIRRWLTPLALAGLIVAAPQPLSAAPGKPQVVPRVETPRARSLRPVRRTTRAPGEARTAPLAKERPARLTPRRALSTGALPAMNLYHLHNRESVRIRPYDAKGRVRGQAVEQFTRFMRCHHTDQVLPIDPRLLTVLYDLWLHFGQPQVTVFSGHRPAVVARLKTSRHVIGKAIDFNFDGVANTRVRDYLLRHYDQVGVGFYPNSWHLHLDVRPQKRFWVDYGGPNEEAIYSRDPRGDVRRGVARRGFKPVPRAAGAPSGRASRTADDGDGPEVAVPERPTGLRPMDGPGGQRPGGDAAPRPLERPASGEPDPAE